MRPEDIESSSQESRSIPAEKITEPLVMDAVAFLRDKRDTLKTAEWVLQGAQEGVALAEKQLKRALFGPEIEDIHADMPDEQHKQTAKAILRAIGNPDYLQK
jgi:hypothetical protein